MDGSGFAQPEELLLCDRSFKQLNVTSPWRVSVSGASVAVEVFFVFSFSCAARICLSTAEPLQRFDLQKVFNCM